MTKKILPWLLVAAFVTLIRPGMAAEVVDGEQTLFCALSQYSQCDPIGGCQAVLADDINAPRWLEVNFKESAVAGITQPTDSIKLSEVERIEDVADVIMLQGAEPDLDPGIAALGFTLAISRPTGRATLSASGNDIAFVAFGSCLAVAP